MLFKVSGRNLASASINLSVILEYITIVTVDPVISKALYFRCCARCCIIDLFRVYNFRCCLHKTVLDFRINRVVGFK